MAARRSVETTPGGALVVTGAGIGLYRLLALRSACKLEILGMRRRGQSALSIARAEFGMPPRAKADAVLARIADAIAQAEADCRKADAASNADAPCGPMGCGAQAGEPCRPGCEWAAEADADDTGGEWRPERGPENGRGTG